MVRRSPYLGLFDDVEVRRWFENLERGSPITSRVYRRRLGFFCGHYGVTPKELASKDVREIENMIQDFFSFLEGKGRAPGLLLSYKKAVRSWCEWSGKLLQRRIKVKDSGRTPTLEGEVIPTQEQLRQTLYSDRTPIRTRVVIALMAFSGLRFQSMGNFDGSDGLKVGDMPELVVEDGRVTLKRIPAEIIVRPNLNKARHRYVTFLNEEGCRLVEEYLNRRLNSGEKIDQDTPVIATSKFYDARGKPSSKPSNGSVKSMTSDKIRDNVREALRDLGFRWRPYIFRSFFDTQLMLADSRGKISHAYQQFWMGHKGDMEAVYTTNKGRLSEDVVKDMRDAYMRCDEYLSIKPSARQEDPELTTIRTMVESGVLDLSKSTVRNYLIQKLGIQDMEVKVASMKESGYAEDDANVRVICGELGIEPMKIEAFKPKNNDDPKKVVCEDELERYLAEGWDVQTMLPSGKILIRK